MSGVRVLVIVQGELGDHPSGPEIRGWEVARRFAERHDVTIAATVDEPTERDGILVVPRARASLLREARRHDVVIGPLLPPFLLGALARRPAVRVADLYDPVDLELGTLDRSRRMERSVARQLALRTLQLRWSDVVVCANDRQRERMLQALHPDGPLGRRGDPPALVTVPMGLPDSLPAGDLRPLRTRFDVPADAPLVLWWGTVWRWLDAETVIHAMALLRTRRPGLRLVITAGPPPNRSTDPLNATGDARALAERLGLLGRQVHFLDEWVPYEQRHHYLGDADLGITLHGDGPESSLAARARYTDYVGAGLPSVLARGDEFADEMAAAGAARLVAPHDAQATAAAIEWFVDDPAGLEAARAGCAAIAERYRWSAVLEPLVRQVEAMWPTGGSRGRALAIARDGGGYYARRVVDTLTVVPSARRSSSSSR